jgi:hypothetical protein
MASVASNGTRQHAITSYFTHFKPPKNGEVSRFFTGTFIKSEGVTSFKTGHFPGFQAALQRVPSLTRLGCTSLSNPTIAGEFRMARLAGNDLDDKYLVMNEMWIGQIF